MWAWGKNEKGIKTEHLNILITPIKGALLWPFLEKFNLASNNKQNLFGKKKKTLELWRPNKPIASLNQTPR